MSRSPRRSPRLLRPRAQPPDFHGIASNLRFRLRAVISSGASEGSMPTIVMVHGAFCGGWAFEAFRAPFEARGWTVLAPDLPGHADRQPVSGLSMSDYADSIVRLCAELPE